MQRKIRAGPTTRKNRKTCRPVPTAGKCAFLTEYAPAVATTLNALLFQRVHKRVHKKIGVDIMGSDNDPAQILAALELELPPGVALLAIGTSDYSHLSPVPFHTAKEVIGMDENPLTALRKKKQASMPVAMRLLKEGAIDALVSAGNTGALVTSAKMTVGTFPQIHRPALLALMPTKKRPVAVVDVGANVQVKTEHLLQFALIASAYLRARGIEWPRIGLLNIGSEPIKGTSESRLAYQALQSLQNPPFRFVGNVEGTAVFDGEADGLITDGFTGNVLLKTAEGIASLILDRLLAHIQPDILQKLTPELEDLQHHLHYAGYPGALLAGLRKIVIKCHGYSTPQAIAKAVLGAATLIGERFTDVFQEKLKSISGKL